MTWRRRQEGGDLGHPASPPGCGTKHRYLGLRLPRDGCRGERSCSRRPLLVAIDSLRPASEIPHENGLVPVSGRLRVVRCVLQGERGETTSYGGRVPNAPWDWRWRPAPDARWGKKIVQLLAPPPICPPHAFLLEVCSGPRPDQLCDNNCVRGPRNGKSAAVPQW